MFISYTETKFDYDDNTKLYKWEYKIIDSEFEEICANTSAVQVFGLLVAGEAVIDTYEKRNLNVATNLIKAFIWLNKEYGWPISNIVNWNKQYNPKFAKYEEQLNKYLTLI